MVSGLKVINYEKLMEVGLTTLEERLHQPDMTQVYKILKEKDMVKSNTWFLSVNNAEWNKRSTADPFNLRVQSARLRVRRNLFPTELLKTGKNSFPFK
jgi:hypothetical protein